MQCGEWFLLEIALESTKGEWVHHTKHTCFWGFREGPPTLCFSEWKVWGVFLIEKDIKIENAYIKIPSTCENLGNIYPSLYIGIFSLEWLLIGLKLTCGLDLCCQGLNSYSTACYLDDSGLLHLVCLRLH